MVLRCPWKVTQNVFLRNSTVVVKHRKYVKVPSDFDSSKRVKKKKKKCDNRWSHLCLIHFLIRKHKTNTEKQDWPCLNAAFRLEVILDGHFIFSAHFIVSHCFLHPCKTKKMLQTQRNVCVVTAVSPLCHTLVRALMHFVTDEVEEEKKIIPKLNIPLAVIGSICSARTDCGILLPCWSAVYLSSLPPSPLFPLLQYGTLHFIVSLCSTAVA